MSTALARHKLVWGLDSPARHAHHPDQRRPGPTRRYLNARRTGDVAGVYVQDEFALQPNLTLHTGLRWGSRRAAPAR